MTKKMRITFFICAGFLGAIVIFTAAFLMYFQHDYANGAKLAIGSGPATGSSYGIINTSDLYTLSISFILLMSFIYFIAKS